VLGRHPGVAEVVARYSADDQAVVAHCVFRPGAVPAHRELREFCATGLVEQATPLVFADADVIPLDDNGKTDRAALRTSHVDWTATQRVVAHLWTSVLRHDESGLRDNFFDMGGDSRRVVDLHIRMQRRWPGVLAVGELFDLVCIEAQADAISTRTGNVAAPAPASGPSAHEV
jgi:hypothetical protein